MPSLLRPASRIAGRKAVPALIAADLARVTSRHWRESLSSSDRRRLVTLLKDSRGRPGNLSPKDRRELQRLASEFDLPRLARAMATSVVLAKAPTGRKRRR
ncbi:MAG: hypothetical protein Q7T55_00700 [Solirubrobacteraceae bacterium]|nr:hypothetical protein [Solirubrobacteraceae bacterium]